jgi:hypothetical protein
MVLTSVVGREGGMEKYMAVRQTNEKEMSKQ